MNDAILAIRKFVAVLEACQIEYFIGGSIASIIYGKARTTRDVDFVITIAKSSVTRLVKALEPEFYIDQIAVERSISSGDCFNAIELESVFQVDVFTPEPSEWSKAQFARKQIHRLGTSTEFIETYLASPEDVVLNKLHWFVLGNEVSKLQWDDAIGVLAVQGERLDQAYMQTWAQRLGLSHLLERALAAASS